MMFKCIQFTFIVIVDRSFAAFLVFSWATYDTHAKLAKRQLTIKLLAWGSKQYLAGSWNNKVDFFVVLVSDAVYLIEKFFTKRLKQSCSAPGDPGRLRLVSQLSRQTHARSAYAATFPLRRILQ